MAKLQEQSIVSPGEGDSTDDVTYLDVLSTVRLSNSACHTILSKLLASILRHESSESLRRRYRYHPSEVILVLSVLKQFAEELHKCWATWSSDQKHVAYSFIQEKWCDILVNCDTERVVFQWGRRQYATLLSYFHYCQGMVNRDLPLSVMRALLVEGRDGEEDMEIEKVVYLYSFFQ